MKQLEYFALLIVCITVIVCVWMCTSTDRYRSDNETKVDLARVAAQGQ